MLVGRRIAGQTITGTGRIPAPQGWDGIGGEHAVTTPRLIGLRIPDAIAVLRDIGVDKTRVQFKGPRRGRVIGQTPDATKTRLTSQDIVALRTRAR